jgi:predicted exporter
MKRFNYSKSLAAGFLVLTLGLMAWTIFNFSNIASHVDSNIFSLLPKSDRNQIAKEFIERIGKNGEKSLVILVGSNSLETSLAAEIHFRDLIKELPVVSAASENYSEFLAKLTAHKSGLLTSDDIAHLNTESSNFWVERSNALAYALGSSVVPWKDDPFGLLNDWLYKLGKTSKVRPYGDSLVAQEVDRNYVVVPLKVDDSVNSMNSQIHLADSLNIAINSTKEKFPEVEIVKSGVIFFAAATSKTIEKDISLIGLVSGALVLTLILLVFRSLYAVGVVLITVSIAFLYAVLAAYLLFPKIYILTIAFGTSLIGMSADYCLYWLTASIGDHKDTFERRRYLLPGMSLALITTALGYLLMIATPFSVLSQMAVFSMVGIVAAWLTVVFLFPFIKGLDFNDSKAVNLIKNLQLHVLGPSAKFKALVTIGIIAFSLYGLQATKVDDDLRSMASLDGRLVADQLKASSILGLPSPSQFFVITTSSEQETLEKTENLGGILNKLVADGLITGYQSIVLYVPSIASQKVASQAYASSNKGSASKFLAKGFGMDGMWATNQSRIDPPLTISDIKDLPIYQKLSYLWFDSEGYAGKSSAVLLTGVNSSAAVQVLAGLADHEVSWVNKTQEISELFGNYRTLFSYVIAVGYLLTFVVVYIRYRRDAWRALVPPIFATLLTLAILSLLGETISLLSVVAFALLLGVGTDYGIFLLQYPDDRRVLLSISVAALMTLISFGSLAFSSIPALHSFGIALSFGVFLSWLLTIFFAKRVSEHA